MAFFCVYFKELNCYDYSTAVNREAPKPLQKRGLDLTHSFIHTVVKLETVREIP